MSIAKHLDREINLLSSEAQALQAEGYNEEADTLYSVCDRLRKVSIRIETQACEERIERIELMRAKLNQFIKESAA